jgi:hypothetical protein
MEESGMPKNETTTRACKGKTPLEKKQLAFLRDVGSSLRWYLKWSVDSFVKEGWTGKNPWQGRIRSEKWDGYVEGLLTGLHIAGTGIGCTRIDIDRSPSKYRREYDKEIALWNALKTQLRDELKQADHRIRKIQDALESLDSAP